MDNLQVYKVFEADIVNSALAVIKEIAEPRWIKRTHLQPGRAVKNSSCKYGYCNHVQMPSNAKDFFKEIAPSFENFFLSEIAINRYYPGDYIGSHRDRHDFRRNLVVSLQDSKDGLWLDTENQLIQDQKGQGILITGIGPVHSVPPVQSLRYSLIFLYE